MRLRTQAQARAEIPSAPAAGLALVILFVSLLAGAQSEARGMRIRFAHDPGGEKLPLAREAIFVSILPDASLLIDGEPAPSGALRDRLRAVLSRDPDRPVVLSTSDDTPYGAMVAVLDTLTSPASGAGLGARRVLIPTHAQGRNDVGLLGRDPFAPRAAGE